MDSLEREVLLVLDEFASHVNGGYAVLKYRQRIQSLFRALVDFEPRHRKSDSEIEHNPESVAVRRRVNPAEWSDALNEKEDTLKTTDLNPNSPNLYPRLVVQTFPKNAKRDDTTGGGVIKESEL